MQNYLEKLRAKPKAVRAQFAFLFATGITSVFFLIWVVGLDDRVNITSADPTVAQFQKEQEKEKSSAKNEIKDSAVSDLFGKIKNGMAAVIFSEDRQNKEEEKTIEQKVIDINALIQKPPIQKKQPTATNTTDQNDAVPEEKTGIDDGSVILIGTSTIEERAETGD